jgi:RNA polymerase sigma factor (sigma-70 family)
MADHSADILVRHMRRLAGAPALPSSDDQLLDRFARQGDGEAFAALVGRHGPMVLRVCRRVLRNQHAADDAFQATFLVLARKASAVSHGDRLAGWLHGVAYRVASRARQEEAVRRRHEAGAAVRLSPDAEAVVAARELSAVLDDELQHLPEHFRSPLVLCYLEGLTRDEAAQRMGLSLRTLHRRLERARRLLRARLGRRGVSLSAGLLAAILAGAARATLPAHLASAARAVVVGTVSPAAAALAGATLRAMGSLAPKLTALALLCGLLVLGAGAVALVGGQTAAPPGEVAPPVARAEVSAVPAPPRDPAADPLPGGAPAPGSTPRFAATEKNVRLAWSPDGRFLVSAGKRGTLRIWDAATGRSVAVPAEQPGGVEEIAFSADGKLFATGSNDDEDIRLWETATGHVVRRWSGGNNTFKTVAFSPDGKTLASGNLDEEVLLWDIASGKLIRKWRAHKACISVVRFTPDGKKLISGDEDEPLVVWDLESGKALHRLGHFGDDRMFALSRDGRLIAWINRDGGGRYSARVAELTTGKTLHVLHEAAGTRAPFHGSLAFAPDGKTLAGGVKDSIHLWDVATGKELRRWVADPRQVTSLTFAANGRTLASSGAETTIRLWDPRTGKELK